MPEHCAANNEGARPSRLRKPPVSLNTENLQFAGRTDAGHKRRQNEDCFEASPELGLYLVADGVGGHSCGEVASDLVRTTITEAVAGGSDLREALQASHNAVLARIAADEKTQGMGSTAVVLKMDGMHYSLCWVGDSRAYLWDRQLHQLTADHNRASELLASNLITPAQAAVHPERHVLTQSLGVSPSIVIDPGEIHGELQPGQQILLCSDGLTDEVDDVVIARIMGEHRSSEGQVEALVKAALDAGGNDNVTALVVGSYPTSDTRSPADLETTRESAETAPKGRPGESKFPLGALLVVSALAILALWLLL